MKRIIQRVLIALLFLSLEGNLDFAFAGCDPFTPPLCINPPDDVQCFTASGTLCCSTDADCIAAGGPSPTPIPPCIPQSFFPPGCTNPSRIFYCVKGPDVVCCSDGPACTAWGGTPAPAPGPTIKPYDPECPAATGTGIKTALGCIPTDAELFVAMILPWAIGFGGGVAFLFGLYGAFLMATASGDPEKVQAGKELITSVVIGVAVIAFSVLILKTVGVDILGIFGG